VGEIPGTRASTTKQPRPRPGGGAAGGQARQHDAGRRFEQRSWTVRRPSRHPAPPSSSGSPRSVPAPTARSRRDFARAAGRRGHGRIREGGRGSL